MKIKNFEQFLEAFGGANKIAALLGLHQMSVEAWNRRGSGIPAKYWQTLVETKKVTAEDLYRVNCHVAERERAA